MLMFDGDRLGRCYMYTGINQLPSLIRNRSYIQWLSLMESSAYMDIVRYGESSESTRNMTGNKILKGVLSYSNTTE